MTAYQQCVRVLVTLLCLCGAAGTAWAQAGGSTVRAMLRPDGTAFVYHTETLPLGYGFHLYRSRAGGPLERLTEAPVYGARTGEELVDMVPAPLYALVREGLAQETAAPDGPVTPPETLDPFDVLVLLRSDPVAGLGYTFLQPDLARALGRLFIDDDGREGPVTYRFTVVDPFGNETGQTIEGTLRLRETTPGTPTDLAVDQDGALLTVAWRYPARRPGAEDYTMAFDLYRLPEGSSVRRGRLPENAVRVNTRPILRNAAASTHGYYYRLTPDDRAVTFTVQARDMTAQHGAAAAEVTYEVVDVVPPVGVETVNARVVGPRTAVVRWQRAADADVAGYRVYRFTRLDSTARPHRLHAALLPNEATTFVDSTLVPGNRYFYRVAAEDAAGNESALSAAALAEVEDRTPPPAPRDLTARYRTDGAGAVDLTWMAGGAARDLKSFVVARARVGGGTTVPVRLHEDDLTGTSYTDRFDADEILEGSRYRYTVQAIDSTRNVSDAVEVVVAIPNVTPPPAPVDVAAKADALGRVRVEWRPVDALDVEAYVVERAEEGVDWAPLARVGAGVLDWRDEATDVGETYRYRVYAVDVAGHAGPATEAEPLAVGDRVAPRAVRNVRARAAEGGVRVTWEPVPSRDLAGYRVYRADRANGVYGLVHDGLVDATDFMDAGGVGGAFYDVRAVDTSGNESASAAPAQARLATR